LLANEVHRFARVDFQLAELDRGIAELRLGPIEKQRTEKKHQEDQERARVENPKEAAAQQ
jgi:hypothetical protein